MLTTRVAIVGGGLSGLYAALLLEERGIQDYVLLEARDTFGGRIISVPAVHAADGGASSAIDRFDLGATWFWPSMHPELQQLVEQLGLETFPQYETGDMLIERSRAHAPSRIDGFPSSPSALRLAGGMEALVDSVRKRLSAGRLVAGCQVRRLRQSGDGVVVEAENVAGQAVSYGAGHVLLAIPPRLSAGTIDFVPALPDELVRQWKACATWMAPNAKYVAVFDKPFWREQGLSGEARSAVGPMVEIHDASVEGGKAALFGFLGVPARTRRQVEEAVLAAHCRAQFARLFGDRAQKPEAEFLKDWFLDPHVAVAEDEMPGMHHIMRLSNASSDGPWKNRITGVASEWSPNFSGYVAGAIEAARHGVEALAVSGVALPQD